MYSEVQSGKIPKWCWPVAAHSLYYASRVLEAPGAVLEIAAFRGRDGDFQRIMVMLILVAVYPTPPPARCTGEN